MKKAARSIDLAAFFVFVVWLSGTGAYGAARDVGPGCRGPRPVVICARPTPPVRRRWIRASTLSKA